MNINAERDPARIGVRMLEDAYMAWEAAEFAAEQALHAWLAVAGAQDETAYRVYRAAVDREEAAARDLERLHKLAATRVDALIANE